MTKAEVKKWREYAKAVKVYYGQLKDWIKGQPINALDDSGSQPPTPPPAPGNH
jgi:hypothetical protein